MKSLASGLRRQIALGREQEEPKISYPKSLQNCGMLSLFFGIACMLVSGCGSTEGNVALGVAAVTAYGARSPGHEIEQTYYLGIFDPQGQVDPMMYRVRVRGQASLLSGTRFASGWVPAPLIDSLGTDLRLSQPSADFEFTKVDDDWSATLETGRRLVLFGPEGFREAPRDYRLVILMGSSPEKYFQAMDQTLGIVSGELAAQRDTGLMQKLLQAELQVKSEQARLKDLSEDIQAEYEPPKGSEQ